jgi:hypothetical protein
VGYPSGIQTFTTKSAGNTIQPADVNGLQTEVTAVETGILNGFQHGITVAVAGITQSASTGSNNFAGPSTFAGDVVFTGAVTVNSTFTPTPPAVRLSNSVDQGVSNNAWTGLSWDTEAYSFGGLHSTATNSSRITFPGSTGIYHVGATVAWSNGVSTGGDRMVRIFMNDSSGVAAQAMAARSNSLLGQTVGCDVRIASTTDYVTVQVYQDSGSTLSVTNSTLFATACWAHKVRS